MGLDQLEPEDRGFLTWVAAMVRTPLAAFWEGLVGEGRARVTANGSQLERLDLSGIGGKMRQIGGPARALSLPLGGLDALAELDCTGLDLDALDLRPLR